MSKSFINRIPVIILISIITWNISLGAYVGIDTNAPISASTGSIVAPVQVVAETGTEYVRVNFILGPWTSPSDITPHGSQNTTWFNTYDTIINGFVSRGVKVYGLIGAEAVHSSTTNLNTDQYVNEYVANFVQIVEHFKDRIQIFESFNEPNDWAGGTSAQVQPLWFAKMLEKIYRAVKIDNGHNSDPSWQVTLVSGPLFSHDQDTVASYFSQVYYEGIINLGWTEVKNLTGSYPLDGIGYHIYVAEGTTDETTIKNKMTGNINAIWNTIVNYEGAGTAKGLWISEFGWRVSYVGTEDAQAQNLEKGFGVLLADSRIKLATWFCLKDFDAGGYGLFRINGTSETDKKPAWFSFNKIALANKVPLDSSFIYNNIPKEMKANETQQITITVKNTGSKTWSGIGIDNPYRLASANQNAQTGYINDFTWSNFLYGGVFNSPTDTQAYLGKTLATNEQADFSFAITSPNKSGGYAFSARMYDTLEMGYFGGFLGGNLLVQKNNENALTNPGFEFGNISEWIQFGDVDGVISGTWFAGIKSEEGNYFLGSAANYGSKNGGVFQQVNVLSESTYAARAFIRTYHEGSGESACRIGLDPTGGTNPSSTSIVWSPWIASDGKWTPIYTFTIPTSKKITMFLEGHQAASVWNATCFDDCVLVPGFPMEEKSSFFLY